MVEMDQIVTYCAQFLTLKELLTLKQVSIIHQFLLERDQIWEQLVKRDFKPSLQIPYSWQIKYGINHHVNLWNQFIHNKYLSTSRFDLNIPATCYLCQLEQVNKPLIKEMKTNSPLIQCSEHFNIQKTDYYSVSSGCIKLGGTFYYWRTHVFMKKQLVVMELTSVRHQEVLLVLSHLGRINQLIHLAKHKLI